MNCRDLLLLLFLFVSFLIFPVVADMMGNSPPIPPYKRVDSCFEISNVDRFPDYLIVVIHCVPNCTYTTLQKYQYWVIRPGDCLTDNAPGAGLYALRREDFNATAAEENVTYFYQDQRVLSSELLTLLDSPWVPVSSNLTGLKFVLSISSLNATSFEVKKVETIRLYNNISPITSKQKAAQPSSGEHSDLVVPVLVLSGLAALGIVLHILIRREGKKPKA